MGSPVLGVLSVNHKLQYPWFKSERGPLLHVNPVFSPSPLAPLRFSTVNYQRHENQGILRLLVILHGNELIL